MSGAPVTFAGGQIVLPDGVATADLVIKDGHIAAIGGETSPHQIVDCTDCAVLPGMIDVHTDNFERHAEPRPGIFWPFDRAALSHDSELVGAGITTAFNALTVGGNLGDGPRSTIAREGMAALARAGALGLLRADHRLHVRCELSDASLPGQLDALSTNRAELVSLMNHTPGRRQWRNLEKFKAYYTRRYGLSLAEVDALIAMRQAQEPVVVPVNEAHAIAFARASQARLASHDDTETADADDAARAGCTFAEFPTTMAAAAQAHKRGLTVIAGAPNLVRGGSHSGNVAAGDLARAGHLDVLSSDYWPASLLQAVFLLRDIFGWDLASAVKSVTLTPASLLGLADRGALTTGLRADVLIVKQTPLGPVLRETWVKGVRVF